jgi:hypothetical protein
MPEAFSFNREYDFVRMEGLYRATGRPAHEWDIYILKELIDQGHSLFTATLMGMT